MKSFKLICGHCGGDLEKVREGFDCPTCGDYPTKIIQKISHRKSTNEELEQAADIIRSA